MKSGLLRKFVARQSRPAAKIVIEPWVTNLGRVALLVFSGAVIFAFLTQRWAGRVVWTVLIAGLPLFIVLVGYHRWRRICPLAFWAQLPARLRRPGHRHASRWLQANYYYVAFGVFFFSLWLRLVATNGDGPVLAAFLVLISLAALIVGASYTGKTWCNYICPVSFIEKLYTEPRGLSDTPNSQCEKCSACKPACPDINQENSYWKEITSRPKRLVYYAFPGLVFAFYFYYFLQAGTWDYYFSGRWTDQPGMFRWAFLPGHDAATAGFFFYPQAPRALAAALTLALGAVAGVLLFSLAERFLGEWWRQRALGMKEADVRHRMFTLAAFTALVTFYTFAGAPTIRKIPWAPHFFQIAVLVTATLVLARRIQRTQRTYAEETLAKHIIRRWPWEEQPPTDLREAFLIHSIRLQSRATGYAQLLESYRDAVRDVVSSGLVAHAEVQRLESLRNQLQIHDADHHKIMTEIEEEERTRVSDPTRRLSAEKRLQLDTYAHALGDYLERVSLAEGVPDDRFIQQLRLEYGVTAEEHVGVLDQLLGGEEGPGVLLAEAIRTMEGAARTVRALEESRTAAGDLLNVLLRRRWERAVDGLLHTFHFAGDEEKESHVRERLLSTDDAEREAAVRELGANVAPALAERLAAARQRVLEQDAAWALADDGLHAHMTSPDAYVRAAALYVLAERGAADAETLQAMGRDEHPLVSETAVCLVGRQSQLPGLTVLGTIETMAALRSVPIFSSLAPEELAELARSSTERAYAAGQNLCAEGEHGDEVFVLLAGDVQVWRREGDEEKLVNTEQAGGFIGEMAVLDPAPRAATVTAGSAGTRVLVLDGQAFRQALKSSPSVAEGVIRTLAKRLRGAQSRRAGSKVGVGK